MARFIPTATWRRMVESLKEATSVRMVPEYTHHQERGTNHRYYR